MRQTVNLNDVLSPNRVMDYQKNLIRAALYLYYTCISIFLKFHRLQQRQQQFTSAASSSRRTVNFDNALPPNCLTQLHKNYQVVITGCDTGLLPCEPLNGSPQKFYKSCSTSQLAAGKNFATFVFDASSTTPM